MTERVIMHSVVLNQTNQQPSSDHVTFSSGSVDALTNQVVPTECHYLPLETWMAMGTPDTITIRIESGDLLDDDSTH